MNLTLPNLTGFTVTLLLAGASLAETPERHLEQLLARFDAAKGQERDALETAVDAFAGQRHATWSRLYWYRDLTAAKAQARASGRPILSLRMLGRLDQELSCANSRFFRVALYANPDLSRYLREHYVLHWSSERPVPVARIDMGDGRFLTRTVAGNSAHYVLDAQGRPVDVLPGLYSPALFQERLRAAEAVAARVGVLDDASQAAVVSAFHRASQLQTTARFAQLGKLEVLPPGAIRLADGELATVSKRVVEMPVVTSLQLGTQLTLPEVQAWDRAQERWEQLGALVAKQVGDTGLHARSRELMAALGSTDWSRPGERLPDAQLAQVEAGFERRMQADAAFDELVLHPRIHDWFIQAQAPLSFAALNQRLYRELFRTPAEDAWLGMSTPGVFTGLPGDGVSR